MTSSGLVGVGVGDHVVIVGNSVDTVSRGRGGRNVSPRWVRRDRCSLGHSTFRASMIHVGGFSAAITGLRLTVVGSEGSMSINDYVRRNVLVSVMVIIFTPLDTLYR